ncbi:hypothetical protein [Malikia spinosa]|uniref:hypothetical protein n=1 Tax=Malikia spinosa TaxID=86180 RepID=UPI003FA1DD47
MSSHAVSDIISIIGTSYFQPVADLVERMLQHEPVAENSSATGHFENGYAAAITILLVAMLESFVSRIRFLRNNEVVSERDVPDQLEIFFPDLPHKTELSEVFLLRNIVVHNHVWHLALGESDEPETKTLATPKQLGFKPKKTYDSIVDVAKRKTVALGLSASPTSVDRHDVGIVFRVVWKTLVFMNEKNFSHTPLAGQAVKFCGKICQFSDLAKSLPNHYPRDGA